MSRRSLTTVFLFGLSLAGLAGVSGQSLDISSGGAPTITGASGGSVSGSANVQNNLVVTINFGELSPLNTNSIVKVTVPIAVRSNQPYQVTVTYTGSTSANANAVQKSDLGFGVRNFRAMGKDSRVCNNSPHLIYSPFNNDPATSVSLDPSGRAAYPSDLADVATATVILSGPRLSDGGGSRSDKDGYIFDAILAITPQFYAAGTTTATLTFTISSGPNVPC